MSRLSESQLSRPSRRFWVVAGQGQVFQANGYSCAPTAPGYWHVPMLGMSLLERRHLFDTEADALKEAIKDSGTRIQLEQGALAALRSRLAPEPKLKQSGADLIAAERKRQVEEEGWTPEHDEAHGRGELRSAAICYAAGSRMVGSTDQWPWSRFWWKPRDVVSNLVKAGALIAAEIDRLQRAERRVS